MICLGRATITIALSCLTISHSFHINSLPSQRLRNEHGVRSRSVDSHLQLFGSILQNKDHTKLTNHSTTTDRVGVKQSYPHPVPDAELDFMRCGFGVNASTIPSPSPPPPFPYLVKRNTGLKSNYDNSQVERLIIRHLEEEDILRIMPEVVREFGSLVHPQTKNLQQSSTSSLSSLNAKGDDVATQIEDFLFSFTVLFGLTQRVARRKKGYPSTNTNRQCRPDHNVICLVEQRHVRPNDENSDYSNSIHNKKKSKIMHSIGERPGETTDVEEEDNFSSHYIEEEIVGIAELSWQPPIPNRNAPPYVLPYFIKMLVSRLFSPPSTKENATIGGPKGYISNVLVWKNRRGRGYSRVLMAALEGIAKLWGCADIRLHVDADEQSGKIAQQLYGSLGYEGVPDRGMTKRNRVGYEWMGPNMAHEGLYMVDGLPLLYLRKYL